MQNKIISELYTYDRLLKCSSNPYEILKALKTLWYQEDNFQNCYYCELLSKVLDRKKISNEQFHHCEAKISQDEVTKSISSQTNNLLFIDLFILYFMLTLQQKQENSGLCNSLFTNSYIYMVFNKQICMLIYFNQEMGNMNYLK